MKSPLLFLATAFFCCFNGNAQQPMTTTQSLDTKQQSLVVISASTAKGDLAQLQKALGDGLNAGLTINEIKEVLVQLYAYCGFPRSLNALNTFMTVLKERKEKGMTDVIGKEPTPLPANKTTLQLGTELQTQLTGASVKGAIYDFAPAIDTFLKKHLFADIFGRDNLDWKSRELATISALASLGGAAPQLRSHFGVGLYNGLTEAQLKQLVSIIQFKVNAEEGIAANKILQAVLAERQKKNSATETINANDDAKKEEAANNKTAGIIFPKGERITNNNFTGTAYLQQLVMPDSLNKTGVGNVTFEPGARSKWHLHSAGQILLVIDGVGYYQEKGRAKRILRKGDVVKCPPNVPHWHGASKDTAFIQVAITSTTDGGTVWLQAVTDEEYNRDPVK